jgi:hypothetical protein
VILEASTLGLRQIPFACACTPGRSHVHLVFWTALFLVLPVTRAVAGVFHSSLESPLKSLLLIILALGVCSAFVRLGRVSASAMHGLLFEGEITEDLQALHLG